MWKLVLQGISKLNMWPSSIIADKLLIDAIKKNLRSEFF